MEKKNSLKKMTFGAVVATLVVPIAVFGVACGADETTETPNTPPTHSHNYQWVDNGDGTHKQHCSVSGCDTPDKNAGNHDFASGDCVCGKGHPHIAAQAWQNDDTQHWKNCSVTNCTEKLQVVNHDFASGDCICGKANPYMSFKLSDDENSYVVSKGEVDTAEIVIPSSYQGKPVTSIDTTAFYNDGSLTSITIPDSVTSIGIRAFSGCGNLASITLPANLETIGYEAFDNCGKLTSITIPDSVTDIGYDAFRGCGSLQYSESDNGLYLGNSTNQYLWLMGVKSKDITSCVINTGAKYIHSNAFEYCVNLYSITIPDNITYVGYNAFRNCNLIIYCEATEKPGDWESEWNYSSLPVVWNCKEIETDASGYTYVNIDGVRYKLKGEKGVAVGIGGDKKNITIKSSVGYNNASYTIDTIGASAFTGNKSIISVTISDGIKTIESSAFKNCTSLTNISIPDGVTTFETAVFFGCSSLTSIYIPSSVTSVGYNATNTCYAMTVYCETTAKPDGWNGSWNTGGCPVIWNYKSNNTAADGYEYEIIGGLRYKIKDNVAIVTYQPKNITAANIPNSVTYKGNICNVTSIDMGAFSECKNLKGVTIGDNVTVIGMEAFKDCSALESVNIPSCVATIEDGAFSGCGSLTSIIIPSSVTTIKGDAFYGCTSLSIKCEASSRGLYWDSGWNSDNRPVEWNYSSEQ